MEEQEVKYSSAIFHGFCHLLRRSHRRHLTEPKIKLKWRIQGEWDGANLQTDSAKVRNKSRELLLVLTDPHHVFSHDFHRFLAQESDHFKTEITKTREDANHVFGVLGQLFNLVFEFSLFPCHTIFFPFQGSVITRAKKIKSSKQLRFEIGAKMYLMERVTILFCSLMISFRSFFSPNRAAPKKWTEAKLGVNEEVIWQTVSFYPSWEKLAWIIKVWQ